MTVRWRCDVAESRPLPEPQHLLRERPGRGANLVSAQPRRILHRKLRQVLYPARQRRAEQHRLPPPGAVPHDLPDLLRSVGGAPMTQARKQRLKTESSCSRVGVRGLINSGWCESLLL